MKNVFFLVFSGWLVGAETVDTKGIKIMLVPQPRKEVQ